MRKAVSLFTECGGSNVSVIATTMMFLIASAILPLVRAASHLAPSLHGLSAILSLPQLGVLVQPLLFLLPDMESDDAVVVALSEADE